MKKVCIIQARMGSTRLPGKVLKQIRGKTILEIVNERVKKSKLVDEVIFAIPNTEKDEELVRYLEDKNIKYFVGAEENVLERYYLCAKSVGASVVVRVTCDCPLVDWKTIDEILKEMIEDNSIDYIVKEKMPVGITSEGFTIKALENAFINATENYQKEHVISYFLDNEEIFNNKYLKAEGIQDNEFIRLTLDTKEDFELIEKIYKKFHFEVNIEEVIEYLLDKKELLEINDNVKQKTYKEFR